MIREDFPIFQSNPNLTYLDSASSSQKPQVVIDKIVELYSTKYSNVHRGVYDLSYNMTNAYNNAREVVAKYANAKSKNTIFTRNSTEAINLFSQSWVRTHLKKGDIVLVTTLEHHANIVPWQKLSDEIGIQVKWINHNTDLNLDVASFEEQLKDIDIEKIKVLALTAASNVTGSLPNVKQIIAYVKAQNAEIKVCVDACQYSAHSSPDLSDWNADAVVFSAHKLFGPTGIGALCVTDEIVDQMSTYQVGGGMIDTVTFDGYTPAPAPEKFEAGVPAFVEAIAFATALEYIQDVRKDTELYKHTLKLCELAIETLTKRFAEFGLSIYKPTLSPSLPIISFSTELAHPHDVAQIFSQHQVCVRAGHHCAKPLMKALDENSTTRISFMYYNNEEDITRLDSACEELVKVFG
jgi:cysteine desulfurase/selenocysteine lyase